MKRTWIIFSFFALTCAASSNDIYFNQLTTGEGLPCGVVNDIAEDPFGFIWLATEEGLCRFDGQNVKVIRQEPGKEVTLKSSFCRKLLLAPDSTLFILGNEGLSHYDLISEAFLDDIYKADTTNTTSKYIDNFLLDSNNKLWICYNKGVAAYSIKEKKFYYVTNQFSGKELFLDKNGDVLVVNITEDAILKIDAETLESVFLKTGNSQLKTKNGYEGGVYEDHEGIWFYQKNLFLYKPESEQLESIKLPFNEKGRIVAAINVKGILWLATEFGGIIVFDPDSKKVISHYTISDGLADNSIIDITIDSDNNIWTISGGVLHLFSKKYNKFFQYHDNNISSSNANSISHIRENKDYFFESGDGVIWFITMQGVNYFNKDLDRFNFISITNNRQIRALSSLSNDEIIFGSGKGLNILNITDGKIKKIASDIFKTETPDVFSIKKIKQDLYLVGISSLNLMQYNPENNEFIKINQYNPYEFDSESNLSGWLVSAIYEDRFGYLWIGTSKSVSIVNKHDLNENPTTFVNLDSITGNLKNVWAISEGVGDEMWLGFKNGLLKLNRVTGDKTIYKNIPGDTTSLGGSNVKCILRASDNSIWIATEGGGLSLYNPNEDNFINFTVKDGLPSNSVYGILEDDEGVLWLSTNNGLSSFNYKHRLIHNYSLKDGVKDNHFNMLGFYKDNFSGRLFFSSSTGIVHFDPKEIQLLNINPDIYITDIKVDGVSLLPGQKIHDQEVLQKSIFLSERITLSYRSNAIQISFAALDFSAPSEILFKYSFQRQGEEESMSVISHQNTANFYNLPHGKYIFRVYATNSDGIWASHAKDLEIHITPPFYKTLIFKLLLIILIFGLFFFLFRLRTSQMKKRNLVLERNVKERTFEIAMQKQELQVRTEQLEEINATKNKLFSIIAHDLKNPVFAIKNSLNVLVNDLKGIINKKTFGILVSLNSSASSVAQLLENLLMWSRSQSNAISISIQPLVINDLVMNVTNLLLPNIRQKELKLDINCPVKHIALLDKNTMLIIIRNLLSNATKFTPRNGKIEIYSEQKGNFIHLVIKDTGIGMPTDYLKRLFDIKGSINSRKGTEGEDGTGLGLIICKDFITQNRGSLHVESQKDTGTTFMLKLPAYELANNSEEEWNPPSSKIPIQKVASKYTPTNIKKKTSTAFQKLLIVEDNHLLLESYYTILSTDFNVVLAKDGLEGWSKLKDETPDLIITDLVMPGLNGLELSERIKSDPNTCHIPIIMLSAESGESTIIEGYRKQVDDYIIKPFQPELLRERINNLLQNRQLLREKYLRMPEQIVHNNTLSDLDRKLLLKINAIIIKNISDVSFNQERLSREIGMSRNPMYKKIKSLTGCSVNQYIQNTRLQESLSYLSGTDIPISEISYHVGFSDPRYYSTCFTQKYGKSPSNYRKQSKSN